MHLQSVEHIYHHFWVGATANPPTLQSKPHFKRILIQLQIEFRYLGKCLDKNDLAPIPKIGPWFRFNTTFFFAKHLTNFDPTMIKHHNQTDTNVKKEGMSQRSQSVPNAIQSEASATGQGSANAHCKNFYQLWFSSERFICND